MQAVRRAAHKIDDDIKIFAGDIDKNAMARYVADDFWVMPTVDTSAINALIAGCKKRNIQIVVPTRDGELLFWARHKTHFAAEGIFVLVSEESGIRTCLDKLAFSEIGLRFGLPFIPSSRSPERLGPEPYVVKERFGAGSRAIGLNLTLEEAREHAQFLNDPIYQPFINGIEISADAWLDRNSKIKGIVLRKRDMVISGESVVTTTFQDSQIEAVVIQALTRLNLMGPIVMQILLDRDRGSHIIECNARFGGASTASIQVGLDTFYWGFLEAFGFDLNEKPFERMPGEIRQIRLTHDIYIDGNNF
ncbi:hypothetical protein GCM10011430_16060 [Oxalicibacterium solurbis]|uniref:ATP-grasp domain-containing protein n=2 Tax=Oxalicibacterium solurbis TaxID=69280 RepID=A0A8J3B0L0_9BURK|nr:hypothetical protein GCM10011430_16060 [Oxalicibacterium solurbis]